MYAGEKMRYRWTVWFRFRNHHIFNIESNVIVLFRTTVFFCVKLTDHRFRSRTIASTAPGCVVLANKRKNLESRASYTSTKNTRTCSRSYPLQTAKARWRFDFSFLIIAAVGRWKVSSAFCRQRFCASYNILQYRIFSKTSLANSPNVHYTYSAPMCNIL